MLISKNMGEIVKLDLKDRKILVELDMNARMGIKELAKRVGLSRQTVQYRIERMKKDGLLLGAITVFDSVVVGQRWFRVAILLQKITKEKKQGFIDYFKNHKYVLWLGEVGGNWDFVINFVVQDQFQFNKIFEDALSVWGELIQKYEVLAYIHVRDQARRYLLPDYETENATMFHEMKFDSGVKLDELDKKIIFLLSKDAWLSSSNIGRTLDVNYKTIQARIKTLEEGKIILGYRLMIHPRRLGYGTHMVFFGIHVHKPDLEKQIYEFLNHPNITFCVKQLGAWKYGFEAEFQSEEEFQDFMIELRSRFGEAISHYETFPIFRDHVINYFPEGALGSSNI